jgi:ribosome-associated translation inhibitor RaiA
LTPLLFQRIWAYGGQSNYRYGCAHAHPFRCAGTSFAALLSTPSFKELAMQIQVHTDNHIKGSAALTRHVESVVQSTLARFGDRITRVEVHLNDENSSVKAGGNDKRCAMEARLAGLQPITVTKHGDTVEQALDAAADTLQKTLDRHLGRLDDSKGRTSFGGEQMS